MESPNKGPSLLYLMFLLEFHNLFINTVIKYRHQKTSDEEIMVLKTSGFRE